MAGFSELIRNFDKIRDYMRDFYIYGFKSRSQFKRKSSRSYDNEKRRIESYLGDYMRWGYNRNGKNTVISLDSSQIKTNPLYAAWKSKSFTNNDIILHFYLLDAFQSKGSFSINELTESISKKSGVTFDAQTVRNKCVEYHRAGLLLRGQRGKIVFYSLSPLYFKDLVADMSLLGVGVKFFHEAALFGEIGSFILDNEVDGNELFTFKHHYIVHTLEDGMLFEILKAMHENRKICFQNFSEKVERLTTHEGIPLKIFISAATGRRYVCLYMVKRGRFS